MKTTKRNTTTAPLPWNQFRSLVTCQMEWGNTNTALMIASGGYFGLRISDILSLKWQHLMMDEFFLDEKKTGKRRKIQVNKAMRKYIKAAIKNYAGTPDPNDYVFCSQRSNSDTSKPISVVAANKRIRKALQECDIKTQNPSSHTLRKTFARRIYDVHGKSEAALILLSEIFNHENTRVTRKYIGLTDQKIKNALLRM